MKRRFSALYPFLFAAVGVLYIAAQHPGKYGIGDLLAVILVMLAGTAVVYLIAARLTRGRGDTGPAALITMLAVLWCYGLPHLMHVVPGGPANPANVAIALAGLAASGLATWWLADRPAVMRRASTLFTLMGGLLVARFVVDLIADHRGAERAVEDSQLVRELSLPIEGRMPAEAPRRDVYLLVLDEYANADVLRERFGFDNTAFEDSLRALGFHIPASVRSNYAHTLLSIPSLLSASHVHRVGRELPEGATDPTLVNRLLEQSRVASYFKRQGYSYVFFPSHWWVPTQNSALADSVVRVWRGFDPFRELTRTELRRVLQSETAFKYLLREDPLDADYIRRTFDGFSRLAAAEEPVFAFAHVMAPHWPYVFDESCEPPSLAQRTDHTEGYLGQLQCVNSMVLDVVGRLLRESERPPVILIQSDHGTASLKFNNEPSVKHVGDEAARERFGAFGAYYLPDSGAAAFGDSVTVVNVLGNVLRYYFGAELPPEPDDHYLSLARSLFTFERAGPPLTSTVERTTRDPEPEESGHLHPAHSTSRLRGSF